MSNYDDYMMEQEGYEYERGWPHAVPFTGYRDFLESGAYDQGDYWEPRTLAGYGQGPERFYSHGIGDSDRFYGAGFDNEMRDFGWTRDMSQGPRGRLAPYSKDQARRNARRRH
ncbi:hypothetical protein IQ06DRAFT_346603 [Phaeosphaeriaceae sp. SRC1lsM3a]|nr:hypothetical protein IQ06DRAFT_346603 [Stagonospora sp. SRC1lsM3a]